MLKSPLKILKMPRNGSRCYSTASWYFVEFCFPWRKGRYGKKLKNSPKPTRTLMSCHLLKKVCICFLRLWKYQFKPLELSKFHLFLLLNYTVSCMSSYNLTHFDQFQCDFIHSLQDIFLVSSYASIYMSFKIYPRDNFCLIDIF